MKLTPIFTLILLLFFSTGCAFKNPFTPSTTADVTYDNTVSSTEPIRTKAMYRATMRSYTVNGITYTPIIPSIGQTFHGTASWYGPNFHGNQTSNGEYYDMHSATAAHKTLPMNTLVQVTNDKTGASTIVRINDRGPFVKNRIIDLSHQAAVEVDVIKDGTATVTLEILDFDEEARAYASTPAVIVEETSVIDTPIIDPNIPLVYKIQIVSTQNKTKAKALVKKYAIMEGKYQASLKTKTFWQRTYYKVLIGDFQTADEAQNFIADHYFDGAFVVKD